MASLKYFSMVLSFSLTLKSALSFDVIVVANFSTPICMQTVYYDGVSDTTYLFGGLVDYPCTDPDWMYNLETNAFSISDNTIETVGKIPTDY